LRRGCNDFASTAFPLNIWETTVAKQKADKDGRLAKGRELEVNHLAETTDISPNQARELLKRHGNDWQKVRDEAEKFKDEG
jgi:hypothetical protein